MGIIAARLKSLTQGGYLTLVMRCRYWAGIGASLILGLIFIASGLGKLLGQSAFLLNISPVPLMTPRLAIIIAQWLPWVELILGLFLIMGIANRFVAYLSTVLIAAFIFYNSWLISQGLGHEPCGCFGTFEKVLLGELSTVESLYLDIGLLALVSIIVFFYPGNLFTIRPWFLKRARLPAIKGGI